MKKIIENYMKNGFSNGLLLLDQPTGSGKTYSVFEYIHNSIINEHSKKKYFFITTLKKNLDEGSLCNLFKKSGNEALFDEIFLRIDSNADSVKVALENNVENEIPKKIKEWKEFKDLQEKIKDLNELDKNNKLSKELKHKYRKTVEDEFRTSTEPKFRKKIRNELKIFDKIEDRIEAIRTSKEWQWVAKLYPAFFIREKQIIFMSMDKFYLQFSTIVEPPFLLYNSDIIEDAVIFIDEFDSTKETILKNIIQNGLHCKADYIQLFKDIHETFQTHKFPSVLSQNTIDKNKKIANEIFESYSLHYNHKTININQNNNFLFYDHQHHAILDGKKSFVTTKRDDEEKINLIEFVEKKTDRKEDTFLVMLETIQGFFNYFQKSIYTLAKNYQKQKNDNDFTLEDAIHSVLDNFSLGDNEEYIISQILTTPYKNDVTKDYYDLSFYENGFLYYSFLNSNEHDMRTKIMKCSFQNTPEKVLLQVCKKAKVIGISATATFPTNIGNYDIDYLKHELGETFYEVDHDDKERLRNSFKENQSGYEDIKIHTKLLGCNIYDESAWQDLYGKNDLANRTYEDLEIKGYSDYNKKRILRIALAFKEFLLHDDIQSFLCILTKHPKEGDNTLDLIILNKIFEKLSEKFKKGFTAGDHVMQLNGDNYDEKKEEITNRLKNGEKIFVISAYQTIGAGQNLQYPIPEGKEDSLVCINKDRSKTEKDFDAIYLDKPTHIITMLDDDLKDEDFVKYIYQMQYLQESSELSINDTMTYIKNAFACWTTGKKNKLHLVDVYDLKSVNLTSTKIVNQAIGRICRTNMKSKNIYVYADNNIVSAIDPTVLDDRIFNYEFEALVNECNATRKSLGSSEAENKGNLVSARVTARINNMINGNWNDKKIQRWKELRELTLKFPTASKSHLKENENEKYITSHLYIELLSPENVLFYNEQNDYNNVEISFTPNKNYPFSVSEESAKLTKLMKIPEIKEYFESKGYATQFIPNELIMPPPLFNNIYKGALGEVVGKFLFEKFTEIELQEIENVDLFELFDFKVPDRDIYVDFKNWHESTIIPDDEMVDKIRKKAATCNAKCVIIANIMATKRYKIRTRNIDNFKLIEIPFMIDEDSLEYDPNAIKKLRSVCDEYNNNK